MPEIIVKTIDVVRNSVWGFSDSKPTWHHPTDTYAVSASFDPFPAYAHDLEVVRRTARQVQELVPPIWDVELFVADREEYSRTNAFSSVRQKHHGDDEGKTTGYIVMGGKRIPPHPAMTRYLVGHEYGHNVSYMISGARGEKYVHDTPWMKDYAQMRGLDPDEVHHHGNGGNWHSAIGEIFACDFRVVVCGIETEFWPHHGIAHAKDLPQLIDWWDAAKKELRDVA
jgi:hypothetical protein